MKEKIVNPFSICDPSKRVGLHVHVPIYMNHTCTICMYVRMYVIPYL
jgi:hypothetical protein